MVTKELLKQLIVTFQSSLPKVVNPRETALPTDTEKIITLPGVRRCGKSSLFMLTINRLLEQGIEKERILYINFDDDRLPFESGETDKIIEAYRELFPEIHFADVYIFFDEIQEVPDWAKFVRRVYDQESKRIFITGSSSNLLSSELSTSLRGRTLQYEIFPLSFGEYCSFKKIASDYYQVTHKAIIVHAFEDYLIEGGFPEIALCHPDLKLKILQDYYFTMLYKDLCERYQIRNVEAVRYFNLRMLINATKPTSIHKIVNEIKSQNKKFSKDSGYELAAQTENIYLFMPLTKFDFSFVKEVQSAKKYYCIDNGFFKALLPSTDRNRGVLLENALFLHLYRQASPARHLHFMEGASNCDFVWVENRKITQAIQAAWDISDPDTYRREIEAFRNMDCSECFIITSEEEKDVTEFGKTIHIIPAWKYFLLS
jgi:uncharacterized protein